MKYILKLLDLELPIKSYSIFKFKQLLQFYLGSRDLVAKLQGPECKNNSEAGWHFFTQVLVALGSLTCGPSATGAPRWRVGGDVAAGSPTSGPRLSGCENRRKKGLARGGDRTRDSPARARADLLASRAGSVL